jgi:DNA-binding NarL/FixJ family response regulator
MLKASIPRLIRVLLVDDQELVRRGIRSLLEQEPELRVIADVPLQPDVLALAKAEQPDVIVLEPEAVNGGDIALDVISDFTIGAPQSRILILTDFHDPQRYTRFLVHGALGLVLKHQPPTVLVKAIKKLQEGEVWLERTSTAQLLRIATQKRREDNAVETKIRTLTKREREIINGICEGLRNAELASRLFISESTVRNHVTSILRKLKLANRFDLVVFAFRHHFVDQSGAKVPVPSLFT